MKSFAFLALLVACKSQGQSGTSWMPGSQAAAPPPPAAPTAPASAPTAEAPPAQSQPAAAALTGLAAGAPAPDAAPAAPAPAPAAAGAAETGIPECDDFLKQLRECATTKLPGAARDAMLQAAAEESKAWKEVGENPAARGAIADACKQVRESMAASLGSYGCSFGGAGAEAPKGGSFGDQQAAAKASLAARFTESGIPECDDFMRKYLDCIEAKMPESSRQQILDAMLQASAAWKEAASTPEGKKVLSDSCIKMKEQTRQSMASLGCQW